MRAMQGDAARMSDDPIRTAFEEWTRGPRPRGRPDLSVRACARPAVPVSGQPRCRSRCCSSSCGSCSGKHYLLGELFRRQGVPVRHMLCTHRFNDSPLPFPDHMQDLLRKNEILDVHDYLQICVDGDWIDVDATWPLRLRDFGLPATDDWDGKSPMLLTVVPDEHEQMSRRSGQGEGGTAVEADAAPAHVAQAVPRGAQPVGGGVAGGDRAGRVNGGVGAGRRRRRRRPRHRPRDARRDAGAEAAPPRHLHPGLQPAAASCSSTSAPRAKDVYPSYYDVAVGGVVGAGESYDDGAQRELAEELGITGRAAATDPRRFSTRTPTTASTAASTAARTTGRWPCRRRRSPPASGSISTSSSTACASAVLSRRCRGAAALPRPAGERQQGVTRAQRGVDGLAAASLQVAWRAKLARWAALCAPLRSAMVDLKVAATTFQRLVDHPHGLAEVLRPGRRSSTPCTLAVSCFEISTGKNPYAGTPRRRKKRESVPPVVIDSVTTTPG